MKRIVIGVTALGAIALAAPVSAQMYAPYSQMPMSTTYRGPITPEMIDNGSSSDFPTYAPSDISGEQLNRQVRMQNDAADAINSQPPYWMPPR